MGPRRYRLMCPCETPSAAAIVSCVMSCRAASQAAYAGARPIVESPMSPGGHKSVIVAPAGRASVAHDDSCRNDAAGGWSTTAHVAI